jgi:Tfp pilus assembly protein FimT
MIIVTVLAFIALPYTNNDMVMISAEAERLATEIRYAQSLAMTRGQPHWIAFSGNNGYQFFASGAVAVPHPAGEASPVRLQTGTTFALASLPNSLVAFNGLGIPYIDSTPVSSVLATNANITVARGSESRIVRVFSTTGLVRVCAVSGTC